MSPTSRILRGLTRLNIDFPPANGRIFVHFYPNVDELLFILMSCPGLIELSLASVIDSTRTEKVQSITEKKTISLSSLRVVNIQLMHVHVAERLFSSLQLSPNPLSFWTGLLCSSSLLYVKFMQYHTVLHCNVDNHGFGQTDTSILLYHVNDRGERVEAASLGPSDVFDAVCWIVTQSLFYLKVLALELNGNFTAESQQWSNFFYRIDWSSEIWLTHAYDDKTMAVECFKNILVALTPSLDVVEEYDGEDYE